MRSKIMKRKPDKTGRKKKTTKERKKKVEDKKRQGRNGRWMIRRASNSLKEKKRARKKKPAFMSCKQNLSNLTPWFLPPPDAVAQFPDPQVTLSTPDAIS